MCVNNDMQFMQKKKNDHDDNQLGVKARESGIWEETLYYAYHSQA